MERSARLKHLVSLMYFAQQYEWQAVLSFHGAVLLEIERGLLKWGDSLFHLESRTLYGHPKMPKSSTSGGSSTSSTTVLYCRDFQRQQCSFNQAHYGYLRGKRKWLQHICSDCWVQSRKQEHHHTGSSECTFASASSETKKLTTSNTFVHHAESEEVEHDILCNVIVRSQPQSRSCPITVRQHFPKIFSHLITTFR